MRIPARQPYIVNTRKNVHACKSKGAVRMRGTRIHCVQSPEQVHGANTTLGLCRRSSTPHDNPLHSAPHSQSKSSSTTRIPPGEPLNQYSPFSAGQEYHPSCPPPWTNFRHRPRRLSLRFITVKNSILSLFTMHEYCNMMRTSISFFRKFHFRKCIM